MLNSAFCSGFPLWIGCVLELFTAITPAAIAIVVAIIAFKQWQVAKQQAQTAQSKLQLDLYNRRFVVYENTLAFYQRLTSGPKAVLADDFKGIHLAFIKSCKESQFLFDDDSGIFQLLDRLHRESFKITALHKALNQDERALLYEGFQSALKNIEIISELEIKMKPYLNFHKI